MNFYLKRSATTILRLVVFLCLIFFTVNGAAQALPGAACERKKGLVILVDFPDVSRQISTDFVRDRFHKLDFYVREMSYGRVCTEFEFTEWLQLPDSILHYSISPANLAVNKSRVAKLIQDAIDAADAKHDFSRYEYMVVYLGAHFREYGMVGLCGYPGMLGWSQETIFKTKRGQVVPGGIAIFTSQAHLGTLFHDLAHVWGGVRNGKRAVPCLYDHDLQAKYPTRATGFAEALINMGYWDPLSCHFYKLYEPPPGISSWTKSRLGWLDSGKVRVVDRNQDAEVVLGPLEDGAAATLAIKIPLDESTFYLIENRQPIGRFDSHLPGKGVLIMYGDDRVAECRWGRAPVKLMNANSSVPYLQGAAFDLPGKANFRDEKNNIEITLLEKKGHSYKIRIRKLR